MKRLSIRFKIIVWFIVVLIVMLATSLIAFYFIGENASRETAKNDVREMVSMNLDEIRFRQGPLPDKDEESTPHYVIKYADGYIEIDDFKDLISGVACGLYTSDGKLLYGLNFLPNETKDINFVDSTIREVDSGEDSFYIFDRMVTIQGRDNLWVRGMIDRKQDRNQVYTIYRNYMTFLPLMLIFAALIVYIVTRRALLPLNTIVEEVGRINWGSDLKQRVRVKTKDYEISTIVEALNSMLSRLDQSYEAGRRFTSNVSHDLRTPVSIISAQAELALEDDISDDTREAFENIQKQSARTKEILDGLLTYMRLEDMSDAYERTWVDMSSLVAGICSSFTVIDDKNVTMKEEIGNGLYVKGNEALLRGLIENLISNAFKYSKENGHVTVGLAREKGNVKLSVADDGIGIAHEEQEKIFDWMYRSDKTERIEGSGIGLYVVKTVADFHGARVGIESELDKGSVFTVIFPDKEEGEEIDGTEG